MRNHKDNVCFWIAKRVFLGCPDFHSWQHFSMAFLISLSFYKWLHLMPSEAILYTLFGGVLYECCDYLFGGIIKTFDPRGADVGDLVLDGLGACLILLYL